MRELVPGVFDAQLGGVSRHGQLMYASVFVVESRVSEETVLVDTGWPDTTDALLEALAAAGGDPDRLFLTHDGHDHFGGVDAVLERYDPELVMPAAETARRDAVDHDPDRLVDDGDEVAGMKVLTLPGHTEAPASLYLPERRTLIAADTLDGSDRRGLNPGYLLPPPAAYNENHAAAEGSLERLLEYDIASVLVFHGSHVLGDAGEKLERLLRFKEHYQEPAGVVGEHPRD
jgi:glyoxylase-like metal-dependent hydrolase (beta-lactamase superfamily II)